MDQTTHEATNGTAPAHEASGLDALRAQTNDLLAAARSDLDQAHAALKDVGTRRERAKTRIATARREIESLKGERVRAEERVRRAAAEVSRLSAVHSNLTSERAPRIRGGAE